MRIPLSSGFVLIPEGTYDFKITKVTYDPDFGNMEIRLATKEGLNHTERFKLLDAQGEPNEKALNAFSYFAKVAMNDFALDEIDEQDLVGHFIRGTIEHSEAPSKKDKNKTVTFANITEKEPSEGWTETKSEPPTEAPKPATKKSNLLDFLK
jgi:hypothetical protein